MPEGFPAGVPRPWASGQRPRSECSVRPDEVRPVRKPAGLSSPRRAAGKPSVPSTALRRRGSRAAPGREWVPRFQRKLWQVRRVSVLHPDPLA